MQAPLEQDYRELLSEDFDGHTAFASLSPGERLDWLAEAAVAVHELKGLARPGRGTSSKSSVHSEFNDKDRQQ